MADSGDSENEVDNSESTSGESPKIALSDRHTETYQHAVEDARITHANQLEAYNDVNERAWRIVRLNGLVATIFVAGISGVEGLRNTSDCVVALFLIGGIGLAISTLFAIFGQRAKRVNLGPEPDFYSRVRELNSPEQEYLLEVLKGYENWIDSLEEKTANNGKNVSLGLYIFIISVGFILGGTLMSIL